MHGKVIASNNYFDCDTVLVVLNDKLSDMYPDLDVDTAFEHADDILTNWDDEKQKFWQIYPPSEAKTPAVTSDDIITNILRVSAQAPDGEMCFLPVGSELSPEQTQRCAD